MFGASYVSQFLKKKKRGESKDEVSCGREDAKPCGEERGEVRAGGDVKEGKTSSATTGEKNKVLDAKEAAKRKKEFEENRKKAPAMKNMTKKQKEAASEMRPSRQDINVPKASAKPAPQPKKTKKITF